MFYRDYLELITNGRYGDVAGKAVCVPLDLQTLQWGADSLSGGVNTPKLPIYSLGRIPFLYKWPR